MFEGLVRQLILGYLGQYIKDIQKEKLKITLWNGNSTEPHSIFLFYANMNYLYSKKEIQEIIQVIM